MREGQTAKFQRDQLETTLPSLVAYVDSAQAQAGVHHLPIGVIGPIF